MHVLRDAIEFGPFVLDPGTRQLRRLEQELHLSTKAFELLLMLAEQRPKALSKVEIQERLWPDTFVSEANLPGLVKEIRRALDDDSRHPTYVRTLHGFGYAFAAPATAPVDPREAKGSAGQVTFWILDERKTRLSRGENILGRDPDATVWFDRPGVSRFHARITITGDAATIEDLGSKNGTWVQDQRISQPTRLDDGDVIRLGPARATFHVRGAAKSTEVLSIARD
jgi:DNA-binding winged helix-turn-helix (wHTH) protein